jgi:hypothetical protein
MNPDELAFANEQLAGMLKSGLPLGRQPARAGRLDEAWRAAH